MELTCRYETVQCLNFTTNLFSDCFKCQVEDVDIKINSQITVDTSTAKIKDIVRFELTNSKLELIPIKIFEVFTHLIFLYLPNNTGLYEIKKGYFKNAARLIQFWAWDNEISILNNYGFDGAPNLQSIGVHACKIKTIHENAFRGLAKLEIIYMWDNLVTTLHSNTFKDNLLLRELWMKNNKIKTLSYETFKNLKKLKIVIFTDNICINDLFTNDNSRLEQVLNKLCRDNTTNTSMDMEFKKSRMMEDKLRVQLLESKKEYKNLEKLCEQQLIKFKDFEKMHCAL